MPNYLRQIYRLVAQSPAPCLRSITFGSGLAAIGVANMYFGCAALITDSIVIFGVDFTYSRVGLALGFGLFLYKALTHMSQIQSARDALTIALAEEQRVHKSVVESQNQPWLSGKELENLITSSNQDFHGIRRTAQDLLATLRLIGILSVYSFILVAKIRWMAIPLLLSALAITQLYTQNFGLFFAKRNRLLARIDARVILRLALWMNNFKALKINSQLSALFARVNLLRRHYVQHALATEKRRLRAHLVLELLILLLLFICTKASFESSDKMNTAFFLLVVSRLPQHLGPLWNLICHLVAAIPTLERTHHLAGIPKGKCVPALIGSEIRTIELHSASFTYLGATEPVFSSIDVRLKSGDWVLLRGPSGAGKSTLLELLLGWIRPLKGKYLVNGQAIADSENPFSSSSVRYLNGSMPMQSGTLLSNILLGRTYEPHTLTRSLRQVQLSNRFTHLSQELRVPINDVFSKVSQGERQRIALAQALYGSPAFLFLDEALSGVDSQTLNQLLQNLKDSVPSLIFITHREVDLDLFSRIIDVQTLNADAISSRSKSRAGLSAPVALPNARSTGFQRDEIELLLPETISA